MRDARGLGTDTVGREEGAVTERSSRHSRGGVLVVAGIAVLVAAGVGFALLRDDGGSTGSADCAFVVEWDGRTWTGAFGTDRTPVAGDVIGEGIAPGCDDTGR